MSHLCSLRLASVVWLFGAASLPTFAQEPVELRWKFEQGEAFVTEWKQVLESRVTIQDAGGQTLRRIETKYDLSMRIGWTVVSVADDGGAVTEQRIESLTLAVRAPGNVLRQVQLPSPEEPPKEFAALSAALKGALGVPIRVTLSPRGEPLSVELPEAWTKLAENEDLGPSAQQLSTPEGWKRLLASSTTPLPEKPVVVGETWTNEDPPLGALPYRMTTDWTLAGVKNDVAILTFRSKVEQVAGDDGAGEGGASPGEAAETAGVAVTGFERTGSATFDLAEGTLLSLQSQSKLNLGKRSGEYLLSTQQSGAVTVETKKIDPQAPANDQQVPPSETPASEEPANQN
jgi:hypothetical protein